MRAAIFAALCLLAGPVFADECPCKNETTATSTETTDCPCAGDCPCEGACAGDKAEAAVTVTTTATPCEGCKCEGGKCPQATTVTVTGCKTCAACQTVAATSNATCPCAGKCTAGDCTEGQCSEQTCASCPCCEEPETDCQGNVIVTAAKKCDGCKCGEANTVVVTGTCTGCKACGTCQTVAIAGEATCQSCPCAGGECADGQCAAGTCTAGTCDTCPCGGNEAETDCQGNVIVSAEKKCECDPCKCETCKCGEAATIVVTGTCTGCCPCAGVATCENGTCAGPASVACTEEPQHCISVGIGFASSGITITPNLIFKPGEKATLSLGNDNVTISLTYEPINRDETADQPADDGLTPLVVEDDSEHCEENWLLLGPHQQSMARGPVTLDDVIRR